MRVLPLLLVLPLLSLAACSGSRPPEKKEKPSVPPAATKSSLEAHLEPRSGSKVSGIVEVEPATDSTLLLRYDILGLPKPGNYAFHAHAKGDCSSADAKSAGDHFNPTQSKHGSPLSGEHHAGDFGNILANGAGEARGEISISMSHLENWAELDGKAIIVHAKPDDFSTQPSGNAGDRIACGVLQ